MKVVIVARDPSLTAADVTAHCRKYLAGHPGTVFFGAGELCESLARPVNDREFDVALHLVFRSMADHDAYQQHPRHLQFAAENKPTWKRVRVFDSEIAAAGVSQSAL